jgi:hypothetical protein
LIFDLGAYVHPFGSDFVFVICVLYMHPFGHEFGLGLNPLGLDLWVM